MPLRFRVFLSSPGDVTDERGLARQVLNYLPKERTLRHQVVLEEISWDDPGAPVPLSAHLTPQATINQRRPKPSECDIVVVTLWARMGTPPPEEYRKRDGTRYLSGTEIIEPAAWVCRRGDGGAMAGQSLSWSRCLPTGGRCDLLRLLFADQFEEIFTPRVGEVYRDPFVALIDAIANTTRVRLVLTLRADYYEHCTHYESFADILREGSFPLAMPGARALSEIIERPARAAGLLPEPGLVDAILKDAGTERGALALVEFTLERLYDARADGRLTHTAYRSLEGVGGAVAIQGERAVQDPDGRIDASALARVFRALADVDETGGAVCKRAPLDQFDGPEQLLVERLIAARLLITDRDAAGAPWVEVAHEAVLRHWRRFRLARHQPRLPALEATAPGVGREREPVAGCAARRGQHMVRCAGRRARRVRAGFRRPQP